jgi:hypothetical protein
MPFIHIFVISFRKLLLWPYFSLQTLFGIFNVTDFFCSHQYIYQRIIKSFFIFSEGKTCNRIRCTVRWCSQEGAGAMENGEDMSGPWRATRLWNSIIRSFRQCCGSESEIIRMFCLDPNPKKRSDSDSDTVVGWKFLWKIKNQTLEREKSYVFLFKILFSDVPVQVSEHIRKQFDGTI